MTRTIALSVSVAALLALSGCSKKTEGGGGPIPQESRDIFAQRCSVCHGADGKGTGPGAAALTPKPRDYTDEGWQKSVTDDQLRKVIVEGGPAIGKSPLMVPNADLAGKPEVVSGLVQIIRGFKK
jgi:mono/diheme cytochrome c family protein